VVEDAHSDGWPGARESARGAGSAIAGWYPDPWGRSAWRWWDGKQWSGWISPPEDINPAIVRQIAQDPRPHSEAPAEAPYRERLPGGGPAGLIAVDIDAPDWAPPLGPADPRPASPPAGPAPTAEGA
jgi:hypothetical protein